MKLSQLYGTVCLRFFKKSFRCLVMFVCKLSLKMILMMKNEKLFGLAFEESNF